MSRRTEMIGSTLQQELMSIIMRELSDPRLAGLPSITRVKVSSDLSVADVYVTIMGPPGKQTAALNALRHSAGAIRGKLMKRLPMRTVPFLKFHIDEALRKEMTVLELINKARAELPPEPTPAEGEDAASDDGSRSGITDNSAGAGRANGTSSGDRRPRHEAGLGVTELTDAIGDEPADARDGASRPDPADTNLSDVRADKSSADTGSNDMGSNDTGSADTGSNDTGSTDSRGIDDGPVNAGPDETSAAGRQFDRNQSDRARDRTDTDPAAPSPIDGATVPRQSAASDRPAVSEGKSTEA